MKQGIKPKGVELSPFERFQNLTRGLLAVSKEDLNKAVEKDKKRKK